LIAAAATTARRASKIGRVTKTHRPGRHVGGRCSHDDTADPEMMPLVQQLIRQQTRHWDGKMDADAVQERLLEIIALKKKALGKPSKSQSKAAEPVPTKGNVVNIMDVLRKSIHADAHSGNNNRGKDRSRAANPG